MPVRTDSATRSSHIEEASASPLVIYDPRLPAEKNGKACGAVTGNIDMAATIFALAGEAAPPMDGKSLLPLLANPAGKVRDFLPLFNFWGVDSAQSMAIVTPEWKYIHWYYGEGMKPAEELFHVGNDRHEMTNSVADPNYAGTLAAMRKHYDAELAAIAPNLAPGHGYEKYPTLFSRTVPWEQKAGLLKDKKAKGADGEAESTGGLKKKRKANK